MIGDFESLKILRSLCFDTEWKYAVFWKLTHRARMVLTCEGAYYDNEHDPAENKCSSKTLQKLEDVSDSQDLLGFAVAKMSYDVYSLGEGFVGQVAASGKHRWIYADDHELSPSSSLDGSDWWQNQFSAGIKTIAVVAVAPYGVVQLGSLNIVSENKDLVAHIRDVFMKPPDSSMWHLPPAIRTTVDLQGIPPKSFTSEVVPDYLHHLRKTLKDRPDILFSIFPYLVKDNESSFIGSPPSNNEGMIVDVVNKCENLELLANGAHQIPNLFNSKTMGNLECHRVIGINSRGDRKCEEEICSCKNIAVSSVNLVNQIFPEAVIRDNNLGSAILSSDKVVVDSACLSSDLIDSAVCDRVRLQKLIYSQNELLHVSEPSDVRFQTDLENMEFQTLSCHMDTSSASSKFPGGYELHEALGPAFLRKSKYFDWEPSKSDVVVPEIPDKDLTSDFHLLEAVVANVCESQIDIKSGKSASQSLLTAENYTEPSSRATIVTDSSNHSIGQCFHTGEETQQCLSSSGISGVMSPRKFPSTCPCPGSEQLERSPVLAKNNRKRARPGENSRPRPRDRQLIQDRIKELRDLIPSGAKCSIDSLLERTIKHMLYLQSITKHADKLNKYPDIKLCQKELNSVESSAYEQGSTWAVEVGGSLKVCSILVENLNKSGQMVVEMICEECSHFLEIAETIKSLGLTILKGVTESHGQKTWICFVVEGQSSRSLHRMDILWSLVQILQPKNAV